MEEDEEDNGGPCCEGDESCVQEMLHSHHTRDRWDVRGHLRLEWGSRGTIKGKKGSKGCHIVIIHDTDGMSGAT